MESLVAGLAIERSALCLGGQFSRSQVGSDRFVPRTHAGKEVRWHVVGVSGSGRDLGVCTRGAQAFFSQHRVVVAMNDVVRDSWVMGLPGENRFQNLSALFLVGEGLVGFRSGDGKRQGVEDGRFDVRWVGSL